MTTYRDLRRLCRAVALSTVAATSGVSSQGRVVPPTDRRNVTVDGPFDRSSFSLSACSTGALEESVSDVRPALPVDYLALRTASTRGAGRSWATRAYSGTPCDTAARADICLENIDKRWPFGWNVVFYGSRVPVRIEQFVYSRGDEVGRITNHAELLSFFGGIDTPLEAMWVARTASDRILYWIDCRLPNASASGDGFEVILSEGGGCGGPTYESRMTVSTSGVVEILERRTAYPGDPDCAIGRLTAGTRIPSRERGESIGARLAEMAMLEAAAVFAFERLERELRSLGAPADLVTRARRSARDEARHAACVGALAERYGGIVEHVAPPGMHERGLLEIALENAVEGTVRETFGAVQATFQAETAAAPDIARLFRTIAADETRHAALALDVARWLELRLDDVERIRVREERAAAASSLSWAQVQRADHDATTAAGRALGLPNADAVRSLLTSTFPRVWS